MAFPTNPTIGQTHTIDNKTWVFNGKGWQVSRENEQYFMTPAERTKLQNIEAGAQVNTVNSVNGKTGIVVLTKSDMGLSEVDNTSDINKPISNLQQQALNNKVDKNGTDRLLTQDEAELIEGMSPIEFEVTDVINGIIIPESPTKLYRISTATDLTVTINTGLLDLTKYIKLFVKINLNDYVVLTFPENWYFANLAIPTEVGEYLYEVSSSDGGDTWRASLRYKNIATVGIDQEGNEIVGAKLLFVDGEKADNSGDGLTWLTAKKDIQAAIDIANTGDAVFVKGKLDGLKYLPTTERTPGTARSKSFVMKSDVNVYGGFKGIESTLYERQMVSYLQVMKLPTGTVNIYVDIPKYRSILSGDIDGDSTTTDSDVGNTTTNKTSNAQVIVYGSGNSVVNGFEICHSYCESAGSLTPIYSTITKSLKLVNCKIHNNECRSNNYLYGSIITNCSIISCLVNNNTGYHTSNASQGAYGVIRDSDVYNSVIYSNSNYCGGTAGSMDNAPNKGIVYNCNISNCCLKNNTLTANGTTVLFDSCKVDNSYITLNNSKSFGSTNSTVTNCSFSNNNATYGGACSTGMIISCLIYNNTATYGGGIGKGNVTSTNYATTVINCGIFNNNATLGGGVYSYSSTIFVTLINCSVVGNKATTGAGTYNTILQNTVVYGNKTGALVKSNVYNDNASAETYSAFEDEVRAGTGNISLSVNNSGDATSPCFQSLSNDVGVVDEIYVSNLKILNNSYLIDKGLDSYLTTGYGSLYDLESKPRKVGTIDIGAYENQKTV